MEERFQGRLCEMEAEECALNRAWRLFTKVGAFLPHVPRLHLTWSFPAFPAVHPLISIAGVCCGATALLAAVLVRLTSTPNSRGLSPCCLFAVVLRFALLPPASHLPLATHRVPEVVFARFLDPINNFPRRFSSA